jgi:biuret amidohydrolase
MAMSTNLKVPGSLEEIATPERCALVVYDMQAGILSQLPHGPEVLLKVWKSWTSPGGTASVSFS